MDYSPGYELPPLGSIDITAEDADLGYASAYLQGLIQESRVGREEWVTQALRNYNIFEYGTPYVVDDDEIVINEIQNAIITQTDIQTKEPPRVTLEPVETGEPGEFYWNGPQEIGLTLGLLPQQVAEWEDPATGNIMHPLAIDEDIAEMIQQQIEAGVIKGEWLVEVNDQLIADTYQVLFDVTWSRSRMDRIIRSVLLWTNVLGWQMPMYEWDDDKKRHIVRVLPIVQVYMDDTVEDVDDAMYVVVDLVIDANYAIRQYPQIADYIRQKSTPGTPSKSSDATLSARFDRDFKRKTVSLRIGWLRDQPALYPPQLAIERGLVELRQVPDLAELMTETPPHQPPPSSIETQVEPDPNYSGPLSGEDQPPPDRFVAPDGTPMRYAMFKKGPQGESTDEEIDTDSEDWPTYSTLRQITTCHDMVVDDRECEFYDIPVMHNVNIPLLLQPWGQGEPQRLWKLQKARNRMVNALVEHCEYFKAPLTAISQSMYDSLVERYKDGYVKPGRTLIVPDELFQASGGVLHNVMEPPLTPPALVQLQDILKTEINDNSGHTDVLQGRASPNVESGKMVEALSTNAASMIGYKSSRTGDFVYRFARLALHSIVWRMEIEDVANIISRYTPGILAAIHERARRMEWDVDVTITSGNGIVNSKKKMEAQTDLQLGALTMQSYRERGGIDDRVEKQREKEEIEHQAELSASMPMQGQPTQGGTSQGGEQPGTPAGRQRQSPTTAGRRTA